MISSGLNIKRFLLIFGDILIFQIALGLTLLIRYQYPTQSIWQQHIAPFAILTILWIVCFYIAGLYDLLLLRDPMKLFRTYVEAMTINLILSFGFFYLFPFFGIAPRTNLFLDFVLSLLLGYGWRILFNRFLADRFQHGNVLFIGPSEEVRQLKDLLKVSSLGLNLHSILPTQGMVDSLLGLKIILQIDDLPNIIRDEKISTIILGIRLDDQPNIKQALYRALFSPIRLLDRAEIEEAATGSIPLSHVNESWFLHHLRESEKAWYETAKRVTDILLSIPFAVLTCISYPFVALAIKLSSKGPILFSQLRVGHHGSTIRIWKFRTMHVDAEAAGPQFTANAKTDPRLFYFGRLLRRLRIDELPQIWNVLKGDLSLIGPRPERPEFVAPLVERMPHYALRHLTKPGLTGWAQVRFLTPTAQLEDNLKKLQYDLFYIKHRSLLLDLAILLRTIGIVIRRQGT